jgi:hypothetical protein
LLEWLNQSLVRPDFKFGNRPSVNPGDRDWPKNFFRWDICDEAHNFRHSFGGNMKVYRRVEVTFPAMTENEAVSSAIMKSLLDEFSAIRIIPRFLISLQDTTRLTELNHSQGATSSLLVDENMKSGRLWMRQGGGVILILVVKRKMIRRNSFTSLKWKECPCSEIARQTLFHNC